MLAQEEARALGAPSIGTEHLLLGMLRVDDEAAARALQDAGVSADGVRAELRRRTTPGRTPHPGDHIPFTPGAKKMLERSLREAIQLGSKEIGTEHLLLGLLDDGQGVGIEVLSALGAKVALLRKEVLDLVDSPEGPAYSARLMPNRATARAVSCSFCGTDSPECGALFHAEEGLVVCERCLEGRETPDD